MRHIAFLIPPANVLYINIYDNNYISNTFIAQLLYIISHSACHINVQEGYIATKQNRKNILYNIRNTNSYNL